MEAKDLAGSEEIVMNTVETPEAESVLAVPVPYRGIAFKINQQLNALTALRELAHTLESGLATKTSIKTTATALRSGLYTSKTAIHGLYKTTLETQKTLIGTIGDVQADAKRAALTARIAADKAALEAL